MKIIIDIGHPAHVHFFKNFIWKMEKRGHEILITARNKEVTFNLLNEYKFNYIFTSKQYKGIGLVYELIKRDIQMYKICKIYKPDFILGIGNPIVAHISKITKTKSIIFTDTEHAKLANLITFPFSDIICTPSSFKQNLGRKHIKYNGYHELAYLHPNYFKPNKEVLKYLSIKDGEKYIIIRFVSWGASHDVGQYGVNDKISFIKKLEKKCKIFISSECSLPNELEQYRISIPPELMHDALYYATLYIGEGGTTASEAAVLGTHSIHISTTAKYCGVFNDLNKYKLLWTTDNEEEAISIAHDLLEQTDLQENGKKKRDLLIKDKIDVTQYFINYLKSL